MDSRVISPAAADALMRQVGAHLNWLGRLRRRMELLGFSPEDPLYRACSEAYNAMQELHVRAHYASCTSGVGHVAR
jgi:hypothetical protein